MATRSVSKKTGGAARATAIRNGLHQIDRDLGAARQTLACAAEALHAAEEGGDDEESRELGAAAICVVNRCVRALFEVECAVDRLSTVGLLGAAMITPCRPMSVNHARCLAMAYELHRLLGEVRDEPGNGEGSPVESALDLMDDVIEHLEPAAFDGTEPAPLSGIVQHRTFHALTSKRWRR